MVITSKTIKTLVWPYEIARWRPDLKAVMIDHTRDFRYPEPGEVMLLHFEAVPDGVPYPPNNMYLVADESHCLLNHASQRTRRFRSLATKVRKRKGTVWVLTGTPVDDPKHLYACLVNLGLASSLFPDKQQYQTLMGGYLDNVFVGRDQFNKPKFQKVWKYDPAKVDPQIKTIIAPYLIRRTKEEARPEMPEGIEIDYNLRMKDKDLLKSLDALSQILASVPDEQFIARLAASGKSAFELKEQMARVKLAGTIDLLTSLLDQGEQVIVASCYLYPVQSVVAQFKQAKLMTGDTPLKERDKMVRDFQAGKLRVIAMTMATGGQGITLDAACHTIFNDMDWVPRVYDQMKGRTLRGAQKRTCNFHRMLIDHPLEKRIMDRLEFKNKYTQTVLGDLPFAPPQRLRDLATLLHNLQVLGGLSVSVAMPPSINVPLSQEHCRVYKEEVPSTEGYWKILEHEARILGLTEGQWELLRR